MYTDPSRCPGIMFTKNYFADPNGSSLEASELENLQEHLKSCAPCQTMARHTMIVNAGKNEKKVAAPKKTIRQYLEESIKENGLWDASGTLEPETIWKLACYQNKGLSDRFSMDSEFIGLGNDVSIAVTLTVAALVDLNSRTAHLKRIAVA